MDEQNLLDKQNPDQNPGLRDTPLPVQTEKDSGLYSVIAVPYHTHAGGDSPRINMRDIDGGSTITLPPTPINDRTYYGIIESGTAGTTISFGQVVYLDSTSKQWKLANAGAASTSGGMKIGLCVLPSTVGNQTTILLYGKIRSIANYNFTTGGDVLYIGTSDGTLTQTQPSAVNQVIRVMGFASNNTVSEIFFYPSPDYVTHN